MARAFSFWMIALVGVLFAWKASVAEGAEFTDLLRRLPANANAVVVVNAERVLASPLAKREDWAQKFADAFEATPLILPPAATQCVLGARIDLDALRVDWQAAVMELSVDPSTADVAARRHGAVDAVSGVDAVWLGGKTCVLKFAPRTFGLLTPAGRQDAAAWAVTAKSPDAARVSPYLLQSVGYADSAGTEIILAVDVSDAFRLDQIRAAVAKSPLLADVPAEQATAVLASWRGLKLGVRVGDALTGRVQFDFAENPEPLAPHAKPLMLALLGRAGAMLDSFAEWTPQVDQQSLSLRGPLTSDDMRRLFSVLAIDAAAVDRPEPAAEPSGADRAAKASLRYFRAVGKYVDDAQRLGRARSFGQAELWIENYARKVEGLPTADVDPELVEYGDYVAQTFRSVVAEAQGVADQAAAASSSRVKNYRIGLLPTARTVNYGGYHTRQYAPYGYAEVDPAADREEQAKLAQRAYEGVEAARAAIGRLAADHEAVRGKLSERYKTKF